MIRRRRMPSACSRKTAPCANCWPPRSARMPRPPGVVRRLAWWLISAPGAALVRWRSLLGREDAPITGKRVGWATLTVLYTLAIYGALVLLVVYWSTPNSERTGASAASRAAAAAALAAPTGSGTGACRCRPGRTPPRTGARVGPAHVPTRHPAPRLKRPRGIPTRRGLAPLPRPRLRQPGARARPHAPDHRNPRRTARQLAGCIEGRATTLRGIEFLRPAGLRLGRAHAILRTQPRMGYRQGMPCPPVNGPVGSSEPTHGQE